MTHSHIPTNIGNLSWQMQIKEQKRYQPRYSPTLSSSQYSRNLRNKRPICDTEKTIRRFLPPSFPKCGPLLGYLLSIVSAARFDIKPILTDSSFLTEWLTSAYCRNVAYCFALCSALLSHYRHCNISSQQFVRGSSKIRLFQVHNSLHPLPSFRSSCQKPNVQLNNSTTTLK